MNDIHEFLEVAAAIFAAVVALLVWLTYLEQSLDAERKPRPARPGWSGRSGPASAVSAWVKARRSV